MTTATTLYTPAVLALATGLAAFPLHDDLPFSASARAPVCGSAITVGLALDGAGQITALGMKVQACAIGQAAAALFARGAAQHSTADISAALTGLERWLGGAAPLPDWPGLDAIASAHAYPARHGAILLPWKAAVAALSQAL